MHLWKLKKKTVQEGLGTWDGIFVLSMCFFVLFLITNRLNHLCFCLCRKQCVQTFNDFDFLKDIVSKVPDLGGHVASGDDRIVCKRRFVNLFNYYVLFIGIVLLVC